MTNRNKITDYDLYTEKDEFGNNHLYMRLVLCCENDDENIETVIDKIDTGIYVGAKAVLEIYSFSDSIHSYTEQTINIGNNKFRLEAGKNGDHFICKIIRHKSEKVTM